MLMECDREKSISFIPHSYSICFSRARERERGGGGGGTNAVFFPPAIYSTGESGKKRKKQTTQLIVVLSFIMFSSLRKNQYPSAIGFPEYIALQSRQSANSWDLQLKLHAYNYTDEGGASGQQRRDIEGKHSSRQSCKVLYLVSETGKWRAREIHDYHPLHD